MVITNIECMPTLYKTKSENHKYAGCGASCDSKGQARTTFCCPLPRPPLLAKYNYDIYKTPYQV